MKLIIRFTLGLIIVIFVYILFCLTWQMERNVLDSEIAELEFETKVLDERNKSYEDERMTISVICCGKDRLEETLNLLKSAIMFSKSPLSILVFTDPDLFSPFQKMWENLPEDHQTRILLKMNEAKYPVSVDASKWKVMFRLCSSLRLFLPILLPSEDAVLYTDSDVLYMSPLEGLWRHFHSFNDTQLVAVTPEHENSASGWYNRFSKHPYYGKLGINSGVMLMNLTRMRMFRWEDYVVPLKEHYEPHLRWGDQDVLNILFHFHPELVYLWDCTYNYRPDHCMYGSVCKLAEAEGVRVLHANRRASYTDRHPVFRDIFAIFNKFQLDFGNLVEDLYEPLHLILSNRSDMCSLGPSTYLKHIERIISVAE